jgi:hypothetical protein
MLSESIPQELAAVRNAHQIHPCLEAPVTILWIQKACQKYDGIVKILIKVVCKLVDQDLNQVCALRGKIPRPFSSTKLSILQSRKTQLERMTELNDSRKNRMDCCKVQSTHVRHCISNSTSARHYIQPLVPMLFVKLRALGPWLCILRTCLCHNIRDRTTVLQEYFAHEQQAKKLCLAVELILVLQPIIFLLALKKCLNSVLVVDELNHSLRCINERLTCKLLILFCSKAQFLKGCLHNIAQTMRDTRESKTSNKLCSALFYCCLIAGHTKELPKG